MHLHLTDLFGRQTLSLAHLAVTPPNFKTRGERPGPLTGDG